MKKLLFVVLLFVSAYGAEAQVKGKVLDGKTIEIETDVPGTYTLMYEGAGHRPLADYAPICTLDSEHVANYEDFIDANIAPVDAKSIGVYDAEGRTVVTFDQISVATIEDYDTFRKEACAALLG